MTEPFRHCLLVVDDEPSICDSVRDLLRRRYRVLTAHGAAEGAALMEQYEVHLVMTDQRMPKITGVEFLTRVRVQHPQAVRMLFTGYADTGAIIDAINQGHIFAFLKKPWDPEVLEATVAEAAEEYDRIVTQIEENGRLRAEVDGLRERVSSLEHEVDTLRHSLPPPRNP